MHLSQGQVSSISRWAFVWVLGLLGGVLAGCGSGTAPKSKTQVYVNPGDGVLVASSDPDGVAVFGVRDDNGIPTQITEMVIPAANKDPNDKARVLFNSAQKIEQVWLGSGDSANIEYVSATRIIMTIRSVKDGKSERVTIDLPAPKAGLAAFAKVQPLATGVITGTVASRCGNTPLDAVVQGSYKTAVSKGTPIAFNQFSTGNWRYTLPGLPASDKNTKLRQIMDTVNNLWSTICVADAGLESVLGSTQGTDLAIEAACAQYFKTPSGRAVCLRLGRTVAKLCPLKDELLTRVELELTDSSAESYDVKILVSYPNTGNASKLFEFTAKASNAFIPTQVSDINTNPNNTTKPDIQDIIISPLDPAPKQSYTVTVSVSCAPENTQLQLSVAGTDNYSKTQTFTITSVNPKAFLTIPGGGQSVRDTITAKILPNGPEKTTVITF
jgi:hypothetical protein